MKLLRDTWLMFVRYFLIFIGNPAWVIIGVIQPVLYLLLFAPLLKSLSHDTPAIRRLYSRRAAPTTSSCPAC